MLSRNRMRLQPTQKAYPEKLGRELYGQKTYGTAEDRYEGPATKKLSNPVPNPGFPRVMVNDWWFRWYPTAFQVVRAAIRQPFGSRFSIIGPGVGSKRTVIISNPVGGVSETVGNGYDVVGRQVQIGNMWSTLNELNVGRRRRGQ